MNASLEGKIKRDDGWKGDASVSTFRVLPFGSPHNGDASVFMEEQVKFG